MKRALMTGLILLSIFVFSVQVRAEEITKETGTEWRHTHTYTDMYEADTNSHADVKEKDQFGRHTPTRLNWIKRPAGYRLSPRIDCKRCLSRRRFAHQHEEVP